MKGFLKFLPFLLTFLLIFGMQTYLDVNNYNKPFLTPFGRPSTAGSTSVNRPAQPIGEDRFTWLSDQDLVIGHFDPAAQKVTEEHRPLPDQDIFETSNYQLVDNDLFWIGKEQVLKRATWQNGKWSSITSIAKGTDTFTIAKSGAQEFLFAGVRQELLVERVGPSGMTPLHTFQIHQLSNMTASVSAQGDLRVGAIDELAGESYELLFFTLDGKSQQVSDLHKVDQIFTGSGTTISDMVFGTDQNFGYYILTYNYKGSKSLSLYSMPLQTLSKGKVVQMKLNSGNTLSYGAYVQPQQGGANLPFIFAANTMKNPRVTGFEAFLSTLQDGKWKQEMTPITNEHSLVQNPVFVTSNGQTTVVFSLFSNYGSYELKYNSDNAIYAQATNRLHASDYTTSMMRVPQYLSLSFVLLILGFAWPMVSYLYLFYFIWKKEDVLYDQANRHFFVAVGLYFVSQVIVFLNYGKMDNLEIYAPSWLQSGFSHVLVLFALQLLTYVLYLPYRKLRFERNAMPEFSYYVGLNVWIVLLTLSYFMAP